MTRIAREIMAAIVATFYLITGRPGSAEIGERVRWVVLVVAGLSRSRRF
jgi:hypothetical protein